jgi:hypothetical protein
VLHNHAVGPFLSGSTSRRSRSRSGTAASTTSCRACSTAAALPSPR